MTMDKKRYYQEHKKELIGRSRKWIKEHPEITKERSKKYYKDNKEKFRIHNKKHHDEIKMRVLKHYSPELKCSKCGFDDWRILQIDHINGGGNKHRIEIDGTTRVGWRIYLWLINNNFPKGFQVLCPNCNWIKAIEQKEIGENKYVRI